MSQQDAAQPALSATGTSDNGPVTCPLRTDNTRIYYVPQEQTVPVIDSLLFPGSSVGLPGTTSPSGTASGGDYILAWLPGVGYAGFLQVPEHLQVATAGQEVCFEVVKAFKPVKSKSILELRGLAFNPSLFTVGFGKLVADMNDCKKGVKYTYNPESVLTVLKDIWNTAETRGPFTRPHVPKDSHKSTSEKTHQMQQSSQRPAKKRKSASYETKQLNRALLLNELVATGMSRERAAEILDTESSGWGVRVSTGSKDQLDLTIEVFRPHQSAPIISAPFETVYKEVAKLWKQEFEAPKPKSPKPSRYTRQQEKTAAALEQRLQTEGLNDIQKEQMRQMIAEVVKPITQEQQETRTEIQKSGVYQGEHGSFRMLQSPTESIESHIVMNGHPVIAAEWLLLNVSFARNS
ncbi:hypothetical protein WJX79_010032 [Trebouxia sp. C0005]